MQPPKQLKDFAFHEFTFWLSHALQMLHHENTMFSWRAAEQNFVSDDILNHSGNTDHKQIFFQYFFI